MMQSSPHKQSLYNQKIIDPFSKGLNLIYHMGNSDQELRIVMSISKEISPVFYLNEVSYDLLKNPLFDLKPRTDVMMPMPFVTNDAIITTQTISL